jgi:hypothetical protein
MAIGRISGPLLKSNLLREGVNLAFETDLLYLDVNNSRVGINTSSPTHDLTVNGSTRTTGLEVPGNAQFADIQISGSTISTTEDTLTLGVGSNTIYQKKLVIDDFDIENNVISTNSANTNIELNPNGTGSVEVFANTNVYGNVYATGSITADGNITLGDADTDTVTFNAEITSDIVPDANNTYSLGTDPGTPGGQQWADVWVDNFYAGTITTSNIVADGIDLALRQGNIYYVAENGDDTYTGNHPNDPYATLQQALTSAASDIALGNPAPTIHIYPGVYTEAFPLTIPAGVTIKGHSLRSVKIVPTVATENNTAFLLNAECTVEDITIADFYAPGYAFKFANNFKVTSRSPYIRNISVITNGSVTSGADPRGYGSADAGGGAYLDGSIAHADSREAGCLFHSVTFITPGVDALTITNGTRVEWLNCFTYFANRGLYALDGATGLKGTGKTAVRVDGASGVFNVGETFSYYDTDGTTLLASGTISSIDTDGKFYVNGNLTGLETAAERGGKTVTANGDAQIDTAIKKFGQASLLLDGTGDYASVTSQDDFGFGTGDFTVEAWVYKTADTGQESIFDFRAGAATDDAVALGVRNSNKPYVYISGAYQIDSATALTLSAWNHIAYVREGTTGTLYLNGSSVGSWTDNTDYGTAKPLTIGAGYTGGFTFWTGNIDEVRISKGVARYTAGFVSPTSEFTSDINTSLLLHLNTDFSDDTLNAQDIRFSGGETASYVTLSDTTDFGGEVRSIASACVYGKYGVVGDGPGVLMYLISHNLAYIGTEELSDNDETNVIQSQEVTELNNAKIRYSSVDHKGDFRVGDLFYINQADGTVDFTTSEFNIDTTGGITINTGGNITNITGDKIETGNLRISGNTIESLSGDINLDADSGTVRITSTSALQLPKGDTLSRPTPATGMIRYNTDTNLFEGYDGNWIALNGVYDLDLDTRITAELTPGANDSTIRFYISNNVVTTIDADKLETLRIEVDDISIDGNVITTETLNTDLVLSSNGAGAVVIDELAFKDSSITNRTADGIMYFQQTGNGYFKIEGTNGFVVPVGTNGERPAQAYRETGMVRYNTEQRYLEIWDGFSWVSVAGATGSISYAAAEDLSIEYALTLG